MGIWWWKYLCLIFLLYIMLICHLIWFWCKLGPGHVLSGTHSYPAHLLRLWGSYFKRDVRAEIVCRDEIKRGIYRSSSAPAKSAASGSSWRERCEELFLIWRRLGFISSVCFWCLRKQQFESVIIQQSNGLPLSEHQQIGFSETQHEQKDKTKAAFLSDHTTVIITLFIYCYMIH